jgi:hypothetical protein
MNQSSTVKQADQAIITAAMTRVHTTTLDAITLPPLVRMTQDRGTAINFNQA